MAEKKQKQAAAAAQEPLTMAQELRAMMDAQDEENPSLTVRQSLCAAVISEAKRGNFRCLEWLYSVSGEQAREGRRLYEIDKRENPQKHLFDDMLL